MAQCRNEFCRREANIDGKWCHHHYNIYPHKCAYLGCATMVVWDDEPWCAIHAPKNQPCLLGWSASENDLDIEKKYSKKNQ